MSLRKPQPPLPELPDSPIAARVVVVTGGRDYAERTRVFEVLDHYRGGIDILAHGACGWDADDSRGFPEMLRGADRWADEWARERKHPRVIRYPAAWKRFGRPAGMRRNALMLDAMRALGDVTVVAFPGGSGTSNCIEVARGLRLNVVEVR